MTTDTETTGTPETPTGNPSSEGYAESRTPDVGAADPTDEVADHHPTDDALIPDEGTEPDTFPRAYVEDLRKEAAGYRDRAKDRDEIAHRLHEALVAATGRLQDPTDLQFDEDHIGDPAKMVTAIDELLEKKPHLASRTPHGNIGQGVAQGTDTVSLAGLLRQGA